jgi:hypothetical protein
LKHLWSVFGIKKEYKLEFQNSNLYCQNLYYPTTSLHFFPFPTRWYACIAQILVLAPTKIGYDLDAITWCASWLFPFWVGCPPPFLTYSSRFSQRSSTSPCKIAQCSCPQPYCAPHPRLCVCIVFVSAPTIVVLFYFPICCVQLHLAFGNNFQVDDEATRIMQTYDSGVASVFDVPTTDARDVSVHYVGVLKDIFKLDYGPLRIATILICCEWIKRATTTAVLHTSRTMLDFGWWIFDTTCWRCLSRLFSQVKPLKSLFQMIFRMRVGRLYFGKNCELGWR